MTGHQIVIFLAGAVVGICLFIIGVFIASALEK